MRYIQPFSAIQRAPAGKPSIPQADCFQKIVIVSLDIFCSHVTVRSQTPKIMTLAMPTDNDSRVVLSMGTLGVSTVAAPCIKPPGAILESLVLPTSPPKILSRQICSYSSVSFRWRSSAPCCVLVVPKGCLGAVEIKCSEVSHHLNLLLSIPRDACGSYISILYRLSPLRKSCSRKPRTA